MGRMTTDDETDGWKGRPDTTANGQNQRYYISRYQRSYHHKRCDHYLSEVKIGLFTVYGACVTIEYMVTHVQLVTQFQVLNLVQMMINYWLINFI